jgi:hypothetical protein
LFHQELKIRISEALHLHVFVQDLFAHDNFGGIGATFTIHDIFGTEPTDQDKE